MNCSKLLTAGPQIKEIERQGLSPDSNIKRQILGEEIVKAIRFPLMSQKEFASVVPDCNILTMKEVGDMMKHYSDVLTTPLPFIQTPRSGPILQCKRFTFVSCALAPWAADKSKIECKQYCITVITDKKIWLHGVQHYGSAYGQCTVDVRVVEGSLTDSLLVKQSGTYTSQKIKAGGFVVDWFDMLFDHKAYKIISDTNGPVRVRN